MGSFHSADAPPPGGLLVAKIAHGGRTPHGPVKVNGQDGWKSGAGMRVAGWQSGRGAMSVRASHWLDIRS